MNVQTIPSSLAPDITIDQVMGSLQVKGWERPEVSVKADPQLLHLDAQEDAIRLSCDGDCEIRLPHGSALQVEAVHGDARLKLLDDQIKISTVHGSLYLRNLAQTQVETVHGELLAKEIAGDMQVEHVSGNAYVRKIQGNCLLEEVSGNLDLSEVDGALTATVHGNVRARLNSLGGTAYTIRADGNAHIRLPQEAGMKLSLHSDAEMITVKLADQSKLYRQESCELTVGSGEANVSIEAGGTLYLSALDSDWSEEEGAGKTAAPAGLPDDFGEQIARQVESQIEAQMEAMTRQLTDNMAALTASLSAAGLSKEDSERIMRQAQESNERAAERAQERMRRAQEKLERKLEAAQRRQEQRAQAADRRSQEAARRGQYVAGPGWSMNWGPSRPPQPPHAPHPPHAAPPPAPVKDQPVSDEERMLILRMLEQKKISIEEAEKLLSALEGGE